MRTALDRRIDRLTERGHPVDLERTIAELAAETGLDPAEVRAEWDHIVEQAQRSGPCTAERVIARYAGELGLPEAELWAEYGRITGPPGDRA